ncbi:hypothetical protein FPOAC1_012613 [Fusarium poae]|uniref:hypothetical protein n=1 Tax=Fusarium poae TaxID=36050 RepID=UPI001CE91BFF|nr:hypothetical protein FPOAC1_012613 [Fusarium poae]KAG8667774.1 hypothetical protein FPOAC1_012613 [Fusarium poae]
MRSQVTLCALWAILIPLCPSNTRFEVFCNSYSTGGNQIGPSFELDDLASCIDLCAVTSDCKAALFDRSQFLCYLLDESDGPASNNLYDSAILLPSEPTTTTATTTAAVAAITSDVSAPTSCSQLDNPSNIDGVEFTLFCGNQATGGNAVDYSNQLQSLTECMEFCVGNLACRAVTFDNSFQECYLYDGFNGFQSDLSKDMAVVSSRPAVTSTTEASAEIPTITSLSASYETSSTIETTSESMETTIYTSSSASTSSGSPETTSAGTIESSLFTTTLSETSEATTSLPTTSSLFTSLSSSQDTPSGSTSDSALQSTLESTSTSAESATTSLEAVSLSTTLPASTSTDSSSSLWSESASETISGAQSASTSAEESASLEPTTIAISIDTTHIDNTNIDMSTAETLTTETPSIETSTVETSATAIISTSTGSSLSDASRVSTETESSSEVSALPSASSTPSARNIPILSEYAFTGCLKSLEGYPSFQEVATDPEMTTRKCVDLAFGSEYIGVYQETCYKADVLDDTEFISDARCDLTCPGDRTLFCGGILGGEQMILHRAIAPNLLLTLYRKKLPSTSDALSSSFSAPPSSSLQATGSQGYGGTSESSGTSQSIQTDSPYSLSSPTTENIGSKTLLVSDSTNTETNSETRLPTSLPTPTAIYTAYSTPTIDDAYTRTRLAETVTTITYSTVNPSNAASLTTTCVPITLLYSPCGCKNQVYPTVDMTTVACTQGGDIVTLTVPKAAYETGRVDYTHPIVQYPSGWNEGHQAHAGSSNYPTGQPAGGSRPGSKNGQPEYPTVATGSQDSYPSYKAHHPVIPTSVGGSSGDDQPEQGNPQPSVPAQGSAEAINNMPMNPSQPSSPKSLTTETRIITTTQLGNSALPSQSSPIDQGQTTSETKGLPYNTPVVVSEACINNLTLWITITALVGIFLM